MKAFRKLLRTPEFDKDIKRLSKRFSTLEKDLEIFINTGLTLYHKLKIDNRGISRIPGLGIEEPKVYKVKKFACRSLKGKGVQSGIRVIYAYFEEEDRIELIDLLQGR